MANLQSKWFGCGKEAPAGYSPRLFIIGTFEERYDENAKPTNVEVAHQYLIEMCCWGGSDKKWDSPKGEWWGYEIPRDRYDQCVAFLTRCLGSPIDRQEALR